MFGSIPYKSLILLTLMSLLGALTVASVAPRAQEGALEIAPPSLEEEDDEATDVAPPPNPEAGPALPSIFAPSANDTNVIETTVDTSKKPEDDEPQIIDYTGRVATLRALEKITARLTEIDVQVGETVDFKTLKVTLRGCSKRPPEEPPETVAFLEIADTHNTEEPVPLFTGWMFASSPALNALQHPVYDVWVIDCKMSSPDIAMGRE